MPPYDCSQIDFDLRAPVPIAASSPSLAYAPIIRHFITRQRESCRRSLRSGSRSAHAEATISAPMLADDDFGQPFLHAAPEPLRQGSCCQRIEAELHATPGWLKELMIRFLLTFRRRRRRRRYLVRFSTGELRAARRYGRSVMPLLREARRRDKSAMALPRRRARRAAFSARRFAFIPRWLSRDF